MSQQDSDLAVPVTSKDRMLGPEDAVATLVEYGDYECPHCGEAYPIVNAVKAQMGDDLRLGYRHFPLTQIHPHAFMSAEAAEAAGAQMRFWEMHGLLFENQNRLDEADLLHYALMLGLDAYRLEQDLATGSFADRVREDMVGGIRSGVKGTPTFFINGKRHEGSYELPVLLAAVMAAADRMQSPSPPPWNVWGQFFPPGMSE